MEGSETPATPIVNGVRATDDNYRRFKFVEAKMKRDPSMQKLYIRSGSIKALDKENSVRITGTVRSLGRDRTKVTAIRTLFESPTPTAVFRRC